MIFNHNSSVSVVMPADATAREQFAAEELSKYIGRILPGIAITLCSDAEEVSGMQILVGGPERNKATGAYISQAEFDAEVPGPEGMLIRTYEDALVVAGSSKNLNEKERGTLYAAYELLERFFGCSFASFVEPSYAGGEYIPVLEEVDLSAVSYVKACADRPYRAGILEFSAGFAGMDNPHALRHLDWMAKNRFNRIVTWTAVYDALKDTPWLEEVIRRGLMITAGHHSAPGTFLPQYGNEYFSEHYYETHPEYFKMLEDGTRFGAGSTGTATEFSGGQWIFCSTNPELIDVLANNILHWSRLNPQVDTIALWPQDFARPQCLCPECSKYTKNENYVRVFNGVAKRIAKEAPHLKMDLLAYSDLYECPEGAKLEPNIFVEAATSYVKVEGRQRRVGKPDGSGLRDTLYEQRLMEWKAAGAQVGYYDYCMGTHACRQRYMPCADEMQSFWKRYIELDIQGSGTQMEYFNFWNHIFNFYTFARTGYDTSLSMGDNLAVFTKMFGEGAPYIASAIRLAESTLDGQRPIRQAAVYLMEVLDMDTMYHLCDKALSVATTPAARNNIRMYRMGLRYSHLQCTYSRVEKDGLKYTPVEEIADPTGELYYMAHRFDSRFWNMDGGFAIELPVNGEDHNYQPDNWYQFEQ